MNKSQNKTGSKLENRSLAIAFNILSAVDANYVIVMPDGKQHTRGDIVVQKSKKEQPRRKMRGNRKYGDLASHYRAFMEDMIVGQIASVPVNGFKPAHLASSMSAWACTNWGAGSAIIASNKDCVEVMRVK